jgi:hypothetical protein
MSPSQGRTDSCRESGLGAARGIVLDQVLALARIAAGVGLPGSDASIRQVEQMRNKLRSQLR